MTHSSTRFSDLVAQYFDTRDTHPILLTRSNTVSTEQLRTLQADLVHTFHDLIGIDIIDTQRVHGDYWSGVFIELSGTHYLAMENGHPIGKQSCHALAMDIHRTFATDHSEQTRGFHIGIDVSAAACLESLEREYFELSG